MTNKYDVIIKEISKNQIRMFFDSEKSKLFADNEFKEKPYYNCSGKYIQLANNEHEILNNTLGVLLTNNIKVVSI